MLRPDLFAVAALPALPAMTGVLPLHVVPAEGEALVSWIASLSAIHGLSPPILCRTAFGIDTAADPTWWRRPSAETLGTISERSGVATSRLAAMTFAGWATARGDEIPHRFGSKSSAPAPPSHHRRRVRHPHIATCPACLAEDTRAHLRLLWMIGWVGICPKHCIPLTARCPSCGGVLGVNHKNRDRDGSAPCRETAMKWFGAPEHTVDAAILQLQTALIAGKQSNQTMLPGVGVLSWPTTMALVDVLLGMVWIDIPAAYRKSLFNRIATELGLDQEGHAAPPWHSNYGGLLILTWLLADLATRLPMAIAILHAPRRDRLIARLPSVPDEVSAPLREILAPALAKRPQSRRSWRHWIDQLPESGADLRERALHERYKLRRRRLFAFAALRDGSPIESAADHVGVSPGTVYRWLHQGARDGLEAALERPMRQSEISGAQAEALGQWIIQSRSHQCVPALIDHAGALFGLNLSKHQASRLLCIHRPAKPGRRHRPWKPRPHRPTTITESTHDPAPGL